ncbi:Palmitoyl-monogalactosyldiacylglycerol delta-7 desaturase [Planctomycetales bacterium 10988]|nr:Palmitoyl-monogalactosyldiacylglycerol delta-7 desaturase [Planctomycetales bacterium 10988]
MSTDPQTTPGFGFSDSTENENEFVVSASTSTIDAPQESKKKRSKYKEPARIDMRETNGIDWVTTGWFSLLHVGALAAPFFFSWQGVGLFVLLWWITGGLGICLGFHRLLTHQSFQTYKPVKWFLAWVGGLAGEGPVITWVSVHRKHHKHSDHHADPHSPIHGGWWSHIIWMTPNVGKPYWNEVRDKYGKDLSKDKVIRFIDSTFMLWHVVTAVGLTAVGYWMGGWYMALSYLTWGFFLRMVWVMHVTWLVNSASHIWGYRNYETTDQSRNNWWVGLLSFGEGWHNNHHAFERVARHGHKWWEVDVTYMTIKAMKAVGLAWKVVDKPSDPPLDETSTAA